jgi:hypothetical protein
VITWSLVVHVGTSPAVKWCVAMVPVLGVVAFWVSCLSFWSDQRAVLPIIPFGGLWFLQVGLLF